MSTRRRIGVSTATSESARRQLMQPVQCWEKVWTTPDDVPSGSTLKVYKWVKTDKKQYFSDDEAEADEPLAPLPDEPEVIDGGDDEVEQEESVAPVTRDTILADVTPQVEESQSLGVPEGIALAAAAAAAASSLVPDDTLDADLVPQVPVLDPAMAVPPDLDPDSLAPMDLSALGPDGAQFEDVHDLTQLQADDAILGGDVIDQSGDPFEAAS